MKKLLQFKKPSFGAMAKLALVCALAFIALFAIVYWGITPEQYDIQVGMPAGTAIYATKDVIDTVTTQALRDAAANAVEPSYKSVDATVLDDVTTQLNTHFSALRKLRASSTASDARAWNETELSSANESIGATLTRDEYATLFEADDATFDAILSDALTETRETLLATLPEGQENDAVRSIQNELQKTYPSTLASAVADIVRADIKPNMLIDEEITETNRQNARDTISDVIYVKDQIIVRQGELVTPSQYAMVESLGLLTDNSVDVPLLIGIAAMVLMLMAAIGFYLYRFNKNILKKPSVFLLYWVIVVLVVVLSWMIKNINTYLMPISLGLILISTLIDPQLGLFTNLVLALLTSLMASSRFSTAMFSIVLMSTLSGSIVTLIFSKHQQRITILMAGLITAFINAATVVVVGLISSAQVVTSLANAGWAAGSAVISALFGLGLQALLEWAFNIPTASKLIELSNPNHPLLRRLLMEAPGTYHHSIIVANLAEAAASAVGANGLLARVGSYYHDVGKLKRPMYFKENQMGDNPHDRTDPRVSAAILTAHPRDGAQLALKSRIPDKVVEIIRQHHGDTATAYFYDKALKLYGDEIDIKSFRYDGPRPSSKEAAIVMLADGVEAATRSISNPNPEKIDDMISKIIKGRLADDQLDHSNLTFNDIEKIRTAFSTVLSGVFHERIEYPDIVLPPRDETEQKAEQKPEPIIEQNSEQKEETTVENRTAVGS